MEPASDVDAAISATVRALAAGRSVTHAETADAIGTALSTFERRLQRGGWSATELVKLSRWFGVSLDDLVTGLGGHVAPSE